MLRMLCLAAAMAVTTVAAADEFDDEFDFTCIDNGERERIAVVREVPGQELPCRVDVQKHQLGVYSMQFGTLWRAENDIAFCRAKLIELVEKLRDRGAKCVTTKRYKGQG